MSRMLGGALRHVSLPTWRSSPQLVRRYKPVSFEDVRKNEVAYEAQIQEAEAELSKLGYPRAAVFRQPVIWGDHDQFEHVNNVHYIRWFETARMRWIERVTSTLSREIRDNLALGRGGGVILASPYCRYRRPVTYPDTIVIGQAPLPMHRRDRAIIRSTAYSVAQRNVVAEGDFDCVAYDYDRLCKATFPEELKEAMKAWVYKGQNPEPFCQKRS